MITKEQIESNWNTFLSNITTYLSSERAAVLRAFYEKHENRFALMPASSKTSYHNAFPGGHVDHINRVLECAMELAVIWKNMGAKINFKSEELVMVAINHDLGKFGTEQAEYFIENDDEWQVKNRGQRYRVDNSIPYMKIQDRSLLILQKIGIKLSENEYLGIKLHDGLYDESNKDYLMASSEYELKSNLPYIIQQAVLMAVRIEKNLQDKNKAQDAPPSDLLVASADVQKQRPEHGT